MKRWLALSVALAIGPLACKSAGHPNSGSHSNLQSDDAVSSEPETYARFAALRLQESYLRFMLELDRIIVRGDGKIEGALEANLSEFKDMLEIFVHVLPRKDDSDPFLDLYAELEEGSRLLSRIRDLDRDQNQGDPGKFRAEINALFVKWVELRASAPIRRRDEAVLNSLNQNTATRRTIPVLDGFCWSQVNYIPHLKAPADQELQALAIALLVTIRSSAREVLSIESILAGDQRQPFLATRRKANGLIAMQKHFPSLLKDLERVQQALPTIRILSERYEKLATLLARFDIVRSTRDETQIEKKKILEKAILEDWTSLKIWQSSVEVAP